MEPKMKTYRKILFCIAVMCILINVNAKTTTDSNECPKATFFYPQNGDVPYGVSQIRIGFDRDMDANIAQFLFRDCQIYPAFHKFSYDKSKKEFTFYFMLEPNTHYTIYSDNSWSFKSIDGKSSKQFEFSFNTASTNNTSDKPKIISLSPAPGEIWNKFTPLQLQFDRPVIPYSGKLTFRPDSFSSGIMPLAPVDEKPATTITIPLILSTSGKVCISDFRTETGAVCEPCEIEFALASRFLSAETENYLKSFETDQEFISLIKNIQEASKNITSVSEKVFITNIAKSHFFAEYGIFRYQKPGQFYCDISGIIHIPFKMGSDGQNCWFFSDSTKDRENGEIRFYQAPYSEINDIDIKFVQTFPANKTPEEIIHKCCLEYIGEEKISNIICKVIRSYNRLEDHYPGITTYWFDSEKFLPVRIVHTDTDNYQLDFVYESINTPLADNKFKFDGPDYFKPEKPESLGQGYTERTITVHDGSDGRMSGRWGKKGPKGTSSSGLN
jgi:outer membrane lipoprotein-sorting protein